MHRYRSPRGAFQAELLILVVVFMLLCFIFATALSQQHHLESQRDALVHRNAIQKPAAAARPTQHRDPVDVPWDLLGLGALGLGALAGAGAGGTVAVRRRKTHRELRDARLARWGNAVTGHDAIATAYADLRLDPIAAIDHMALWDVTDPLTAAFTDAYATVVDLRSLHTTRIPQTDQLIDEYATAVTRARTAWQAAVAHARQVGLEQLPRPERDRAATARKLLTTAANPGASTAERALAAQRAGELLAGLRRVVLPHEMTRELARTARRELA